VKLYKVLLDDGREEFVVADDYQQIDDEYRFFANGQPLSDIFFVASSVVGVNVETDNYERDSGWKGGGSY
jgi:hypothetical protein